jgi:hypothetical protein
VSLGVSADTRRAKGRFYVPCPHVSVLASEDTIYATVPEGLVAAAATMLNACAGASGEDVVVASSIDGNHVVSTVRVGNVLDTQRRRRNRVRETYAVQAL